MDDALDEKMKREIITKALEKSRENERERHVRDVLDALEEMTDLPRAELTRIAARVMATNVRHEDRFFSIRQQLAVTGATLMASLLLLAWLL